MPGKARTASRVVTYTPSSLPCQRTSLVLQHGEAGSMAPSRLFWPPQENTHTLKGLCTTEPGTFKFSSAVMS